MTFEADTEREPLTLHQVAQLKRVALDFAPAAIAEWERAQTDAEMFYALPRATFAAFNLDRHALAEQLALKSLELAPLFEDDGTTATPLTSRTRCLGCSR
jgi:hypothetical protein